MTKLLIDATDIAGLNRRAVARGAVPARRAAAAPAVVDAAVERTGGSVTGDDDESARDGDDAQ